VSNTIDAYSLWIKQFLAFTAQHRNAASIATFLPRFLGELGTRHTTAEEHPHVQHFIASILRIDQHGSRTMRLRQFVYVSLCPRMSRA
jgi:hypothetical protein